MRSSFYIKGSAHKRSRSDTVFTQQNKTIVLLRQHYDDLHTLMGKQAFYNTYIQYKQKILLESLPVGLITADILDIEPEHLDKLEAILNENTGFEKDRVRLDYLLNWWSVNYETLSTEVPFACKQIEPYFNTVLQEIKLWQTIEDYLTHVSKTPTMEESTQYDTLLQLLAQFHQAFEKLFDCKKAQDFIELIGSIRRIYAYWNIPVHPEDQMIGALKIYDHSSKRIMDSANQLQFLQIERITRAEQVEQTEEVAQAARADQAEHIEQAEQTVQAARLAYDVIEKAITRTEQKLQEFQYARDDILNFIQGLEQFWRLKILSLNAHSIDFPLNISDDKKKDTLFFKVSYWLLKREKSQRENHNMPSPVLEESLVNDYSELYDSILTSTQARLPLCVESPVLEHIHAIYNSSFEKPKLTLDTLLSTTEKQLEVSLDERLIGYYTP